MREIRPEEPYQAGDWVCRRLLTPLCRSVTGLPWPILDDLPDLRPGGRKGILAATEMHPRMQSVQAALTAAIGRDHPLTTIARIGTVIVNEAKFQRQGANVRENAVTTTVAAAQRALELRVLDPEVKAISVWDPLADDALPFDGALTAWGAVSL
jgi:hypothetical protein